VIAGKTPSCAEVESLLSSGRGSVKVISAAIANEALVRARRRLTGLRKYTCNFRCPLRSAEAVGSLVETEAGSWRRKAVDVEYHVPAGGWSRALPWQLRFRWESNRDKSPAAVP
jgi:hypothetical protein